eukprot:457860-Pyramimonas_sp.AAC.1
MIHKSRATSDPKTALRIIAEQEPRNTEPSEPNTPGDAEQEPKSDVASEQPNTPGDTEQEPKSDVASEQPNTSGDAEQEEEDANLGETILRVRAVSLDLGAKRKSGHMLHGV